MNGKNSPVLRVMYIILVPIVLLIVLLNSGWLQRVVPAATVGGQRYTVVRYNFYYFDYYNTFLEENESQLADLGYDPKTDSDKQSYDQTLTWEAFFKQEAEKNLAETAYYCTLAEQAGYVFSEEELAPVQAQLAENEAQRSLIGLSAKNYYISYFGAGMTEKTYTEELTRTVEAQAYKAYLTGQYTPPAADISAWLAANPQEAYQAALLRVITLDAQPDRATEEIGTPQLNALEQQLGALVTRYENGTEFDALQAAFSTQKLGDADGTLVATTAAALPQGLADWCLRSQEQLSIGDTYSYVDETTGTAYFAILEGFGGDGSELDAVAALQAQAMEQQQAAALADPPVSRNTFGMLLAAN